MQVQVLYKVICCVMYPQQGSYMQYTNNELFPCFLIINRKVAIHDSYVNMFMHDNTIFTLESQAKQLYFISESSF